MNPILDKILDDFKNPRRSLKLDKPYELEFKNDTERNEQIKKVVKNEYSEYTRNLIMPNTLELTDEQKHNQDQVIEDIYNFEYRSDPSKKTDYDLLKEGYELLNTVYVEQKRCLTNLLTDHMKLAVLYKYKSDDIGVQLNNLLQILTKPSQGDQTSSLEDQRKVETFIAQLSNIVNHFDNKLKVVINSEELTGPQKQSILSKLALQ